MEAARRLWPGSPHSRASWQATLACIFARQPGQPKVLVSFQGCSEVFGSNPALDNMSTLTYTGRT